MKLTEIYRKFIEKCKNFLKFDENDKKALISWGSDLVIYGVMLNGVLTLIGVIPFNWYSWIICGSFVRLTESKFIPWIRRLWIK